MSVSKPATYTRGMRPVIAGADMPFLMDELRSIETTLRDLVAMCPQAADIVPQKPRVGMQRYAVSPWWPVVGQAADAWVFWTGTTWEYL